MSDIKKFTGFIAPDGTTHKSEKDAVTYTGNLKVKAALEAFKSLTPATCKQVVEDEGFVDGGPALFVSDLPAFLFEQREAIEAAYAAASQVRLRKQRADKGRARKTVATNAPGTPGEASA